MTVGVANDSHTVGFCEMVLANSHGRACLIASVLPAVILNSISMAKRSPTPTL